MMGMARVLFLGKVRLKLLLINDKEKEMRKNISLPPFNSIQSQSFGMGVTSTPFHLTLPSISHSHSHTRSSLMPAPYNNNSISIHHHRIRIITIKCVKIDAAETESATIMCEPCNGNGWLICDFCEGQKTNVKAQNNRIYRRCPSCKAVGYVLCSKCKVFKCVTFPDFDDSQITN